MISQPFSINRRKIQITLLKTHEAIYFEQDAQITLQNKFLIYSKAIGIDQSSKNMADFMTAPYLIDKYACYYLIEKQLCEIINKQENKYLLQEMNHNIQQNFAFKVYKNLMQVKKMYLINGHKFGGQFLAYQANPDSNHAKYLVFIDEQSIVCVSKQMKQQVIEKRTAETYKKYNHMSRLSGICKKTGLLARRVQLMQSEKQQQQYKQQYKQEQEQIDYEQIRQQNKEKPRKYGPIRRISH